MGQCTNHPDRETNTLCMKHNIYLCDECRECPDPDIHCKFRSSCPIWFMEKRGGKAIDDVKPDGEGKHYDIQFEPGARKVSVPEGSTLLDAAQAADIPLNASCNGNGACGKCKLVLESGDVHSAPSPLLSDEEKEKNYLLACQATGKHT